MLSGIADRLKPSEGNEKYEAARHSLPDYGRLVHGWEAQPHHLVWIDALTGSQDDLLIVAPPGSAKTNWLIAFCGWQLGLHPDGHIIYASNTARQAYKPSVAIRDTITSPGPYQDVFPGVRPDPAKGWGEAEWFLARPDRGDKDPSLCATGVFGPILGARADLIVMDDCCDEENMSSRHMREKVWAWVNTTLFSRRARGCRRLCICTRWHHDDVAGHLKALGFRTIEMPVVNSEGANLWPAMYPPEVLAEAKVANPRRFQAMYMANPSIPEGTIWKSQYWRYYAQPPELSQRVQSWDTAFKEGEENDFSVCTTWGVGPDGYYLLDVLRQRLEFPQLVSIVEALYRQHRPGLVLVEDAASGQSLLQTLRQQTRIPIMAVKADKSKEARSWATVGLAQGGRVFLPERAPWLAEFEAELEEFPSGRHDDQVDSTTQALAWLGRIAPGTARLSAGSDVVERKLPDEMRFGEAVDPDAPTMPRDRGQAELTVIRPSRWGKLRPP